MKGPLFAALLALALARGGAGLYAATPLPERPLLSPVAARPIAPVFTQGSLMRHVAVMTATGSIGLVAIFAVDVLSLFWVSRLGVDSYKAAVGFASQAGFALTGVNIGFTIAISACVSRALGAGDREGARRLAASGLALTFVVSSALSILLWIFRDAVLADVMHARGDAARQASDFLAVVIPANVPLAVGMGYSGILRACGDAKRAMYVTLSAGIVTAFIDPLLIFGLGLGFQGAAWATLVSRLVLMGVGYWGAVRVHNMVAVPALGDVKRNLKPLSVIGLPSVLANLATPVAAIYVTRVWSDFGEPTVSGGAIVDRVIPLAYGVIFALSSSVGPVMGQNVGARLMSRVRQTLTDSLILAVGYALIAWAVLAICAPAIVTTFGATGASAQFVLLFCRWGALAWVFLTCLFVANAAFNNLGFAYMALLFNWGRATLGTIPCVTLGAYWGGIPGALAGIIAGSAIFSVSAAIVAYYLVARLARRAEAPGIQVQEISA